MLGFVNGRPVKNARSHACSVLLQIDDFCFVPWIRHVKVTCKRLTVLSSYAYMSFTCSLRLNEKVKTIFHLAYPIDCVSEGQTMVLRKRYWNSRVVGKKLLSLNDQALSIPVYTPYTSVNPDSIASSHSFIWFLKVTVLKFTDGLGPHLNVTSYAIKSVDV